VGGKRIPSATHMTLNESDTSPCAHYLHRPCALKPRNARKTGI